MRKSILLSSDDMVTLILLLQLIENILLTGLNKDNTEPLEDIRYKLSGIVTKLKK